MQDRSEFGESENQVESPIGGRGRGNRWGFAVTLLATLILYLLAFPPFNIAEAGYVFAVPVLIGAVRWGLGKRRVLGLYLVGVLAWLILLIWLRHVTWGGTIFLSAILSVFWTAFLVLAIRALQVVQRMAGLQRVIVFVGVAGAGVVLEYLRSVVMTGFPWLPLAASQWNRPAMLQILEWTGSWGLSFVLYFFNIALASYLLSLLTTGKSRKWRMNPEMLIALLLAFALPLILYQGVRGQQREPLAKVGVLQPYIPALLRWDPEKFQRNVQIVRSETFRFLEDQVELILMPEAVLPVPISREDFRLYLEGISLAVETPLLTGIMDERDGKYYSGAAVISPEQGVIEPHYYKRKLVPFGEYIPFADYLPFLKSVLPVVFQPGENAKPLNIDLEGRTLRAGILVCYEDIFPGLAIEVAREEADFLFVATNNAWYGEEAGAYQHAVHSVLRAVETRRPVVRCGNGGWSGWFDEYGNLRDSPLMEKGTIYFRGSGILDIDRDLRWKDRMTFYVRHGNWFVQICAAMLLPLALLLWRFRKVAQ